MITQKIGRLLCIAAALAALLTPVRAQIYVSPSGNDLTNNGSIDSPWKTIPQAISVAVSGDTIYLRGGTHVYATTITISKSGTALSKFYLLAYPEERPLLDFSSMAFGSSNRGIKLNGSFWSIKGIDIKGAGDNGMIIGGHDNIVEFCSFFENRDTGLQLGSGAANNQIINCDSYFNADPSQGNADGFAPKLDVGTGNYFYGCRSWQNSDDGWDGYLRPSNDVTTTLERCWCFRNGYLKSGSASVGNGNGFKLGGSDLKDLRHNFILKNCISFDNRVRGFDQNNNKGSITLLNCTAYRNGTNYGLGQAIDSGQVMTLANCVALGSTGSVAAFAIQQTNSWLLPFTVGDSDFVTIDTAGVRGPRNADGSLPDIHFMNLATGSGLIDAGTDVGLPFNGAAPDLGAFETTGPVDVKDDERLPASFVVNQNYPNPFNPATSIGFRVPYASRISLKVYDLLGREVALLAAGEYPAGFTSVAWDASHFPSGIYFCSFDAATIAVPRQAFRQVRKMVLLR